MMSPLNRGPLMGPRMGPPVGMRPPPPRFARPPMPGLPPRMMGMPPPLPMPMGGPIYGGPPVRQRMGLPRPGSLMRPSGPPPLLRPRNGLPPLMPQIMGPRSIGPRGPLMRPGPRGMLPPPPGGPLHMRPRFTSTNGNNKKHVNNSTKKSNKFEEIELKKPWMTDEIRSEIQKKNKLYAKAKKNKDAKEWDEFKDLRNKVTRMIRDAKNDYLTKNPDQAALYQDEEDFTDQRDENNISSDEENEEVYYCDPCDRDFNSEKLLEQHLNEHRVCGIDNCTFTAHSKVVDLHIKNQHITGHYDRIKKAADIPDWIAERKKQFPTKKNIELKNAANLEKQERGEIIEDKNMRKLMTTRDENNSRQPREKKRRRAKKRRNEIQKPITKIEDTESCQGILPFRGTNYILPECEKKIIETDDEETYSIDDKISDDDDDNDEPITTPCDNSNKQEEIPIEQNNVTPIKTSINNSFSSLVADYGSDTDDEPPDETPIKKVKLSSPELDENSDLNKIQSSDKVPVKLTETTNNNNKNKQQNIIDNKKQKKQTVQIKTKKSLTLLQSILKNDIRHERNYIAQIIKYIHDNNYFDEIKNDK